MSDAIDRAARAEAERKGRDEYWCGDADVFAAGAEWAVAHLRAHDDTTEQAARVLWDYDNDDQTPEWREMAWNDMGGSEPCQERIEYICRARWLASEGLLAPAPLREEWGYLIGTTGYLSVSRKAAEDAVTRTRRDSRLNPRLARILMSDWIEYEANDE